MECFSKQPCSTHASSIKTSVTPRIERQSGGRAEARKHAALFPPAFGTMPLRVGICGPNGRQMAPGKLTCNYRKLRTTGFY